MISQSSSQSPQENVSLMTGRESNDINLSAQNASNKHVDREIPPNKSDREECSQDFHDTDESCAGMSPKDNKYFDEEENEILCASDDEIHTSETKRNQIRELTADCWDDDTSEGDSVNKLPLQQESRGSDPPGILSDEMCSSTNNLEYQMSLPEQLLRNRLARKQRLLKKNELLMKYQQDYRGNSLESSTERKLSMDNPSQHTKMNSRDNFNFLTGKSVTNERPKSPLFLDHMDGDNVSVVASSNGCASSSNARTPHDQSKLESLPQRAIVPLPDEDDRKRVIGCLAAVLASSYSYETAPHLMKKKTSVGATHVLSNATSEDIADGEQFWHTQEPMHQQYLSQKQTRHSHSVGDMPPNPKPNFFSSFNNTFDTNNTFNLNSLTPPSQLTAELAEIRHRIRRHSVLSELLVASAEMLLLDSMHARAYLPMLDGLLTKKEEEENNTQPAIAKKRESWKGRGFGGGGVHPNIHVDGTTSVHGAPSSHDRVSSANRISSSLHGTSPTSQPKLMNLNSPKVSNIQIPVKSIEASKATRRFSSNTLNHSTKRLDTTKQPIESSAQIKERRPSSPPSSSHYSPLDTIIVEKDNIAPFLETLTPGAGFRCIALLLVNHLLSDRRGYDARVRQAFKRLAVVILSHELKVGGILRVDLEDDYDLDELLWSDHKNSTNEEEFCDADELALLASRKFEAMEHAIAARLIAMSSSDSASKKNHKRQSSSTDNQAKQSPNIASSSNVSHGRIALAPKETPLSSQHGVSKEQLMRGLKIGGAGVVGATLFALTGGLAAPGIAAGLAAVAGGSAAAVGVTTVLSSTAALSTIFGVGGAGLAGYKMHRRTKGLTEFDFQKEGMSKRNEAELFSTICISGWLRDARDFQRPWGVFPSHPRISDKLELLERFYFIHNPSNLDRCPKILKHWKGRHFQLWQALNEKYGTDPNNLFPLKEGPRISAELTHEETETIYFLLKELGYLDCDTDSLPKLAQSLPSPPKLHSAQNEIRESLKAQKGILESFNGPDISTISSNLSLFQEDTKDKQSESDDKSAAERSSSSVSNSNQTETTDQKPEKTPPKHLLTVWDYNAQFGGELYTVKWESDLLMELCDSVTDQMIEWGISGTKTILHTTVFASLMTAVTIPYSLAMASNVIDDTWSMAMERADRAGVELAKSLIDSNAGHRPVVLVGFSMGARVIYSCLKELTRQQEIWEDEQQKKGLPSSSGRKRSIRRKSSDEKMQYIREPASIVEDAILMGMPNHVSLKSWESSRRVVAGRLINCYSRKDMILSLMFQLKRMQGILKPVCGTSPVCVNGVENFDVTDLVSAHTDYCLVTGEILKRVRHLQPQRPSISETEVAAIVTTINVANGITPLSQECHNN